MDLTRLTPLPYQISLREYLRSQEPEAWAWFSSVQALSEYTEALRLSLLKNTYRLDADTYPDLFHATEEARDKLGLKVPITIYQAQQSSDLNAALVFIPNEAHIVLQGQLLSLLNQAEIASIMAHELTHYKLWTEDNGDFLIVDRMLNAMTNDPQVQPSHAESFRRFMLYTEIYADRGSYLVCQDKSSVISGLVKIQTGLQKISAENYLKQAEEIFARSEVKTDELTHPESYIRARALDLWIREVSETEILVSKMIEGPLSMMGLDLLDQRKVASLTRRTLTQLLKRPCLQTDMMLGQAKLYFDDFAIPDSDLQDPDLASELNFQDSDLHQYFCYVLLDFATVDKDLERVPLTAALALADLLNLKKFDDIAAKELRISKKELGKLLKDAEVILAAAEKES
jgi:hypothetical protein